MKINILFQISHDLSSMLFQKFHHLEAQTNLINISKICNSMLHCFFTIIYLVSTVMNKLATRNTLACKSNTENKHLAEGLS